VGGYAEAFDPADSLKFIESDERFQQAWPYDVIGLFGKGWDNLKTLDDDVVTLASTATTPDRKIIVSNEEDFFRDFEATHGRSLPVFSAAFGNEWDLYTASIPGISSRVRRAVEKLRTAEALATLVARRRPEFLKGRESARDFAFLNLGLFWEHNWTADGPIQRSARAEWGRRIAAGIESYVEELEADAAYALGGLIRNPGRARRFFVFNPLSWQRTDVADVPIDENTPAHVVDLETGAEVLHKRSRSTGTATPRAAAISVCSPEKFHRSGTAFTRSVPGAGPSQAKALQHGMAESKAPSFA
jgi:alpha-mannosidase